MDDAPLSREPLPPESPLPAPDPALDPARRPRRWRALVAGGVAGGVIAAAVAVPTTLWLDRGDVSASSAPESVVPETPADRTFPDAGPEMSPEPWSTTGSDTATATDAESEGVVLIDVVLAHGAGAGTGMVLTSTGLILTNYHVVEGSTEVSVTIATTGRSYPAEVVGHDEAADVALLQIEATDLTTVNLDEDGTATDEPVTAVGNGGGQGYLSAAPGTIVAEDQSITASDGRGRSADAEDLTGLLKTDAPVVAGYSGGPLLDEDGEVVGITTAASADGTNMASMAGATESYAVPIDDALAVVDRIEAGDESGSIAIGPSAYLGIGVADTSSTQVAEVASEGPAADAGLVAGDTITGLDATTVTTYDALVAALADHEPGDQVRLSWADATGESQSATLTLGANPAN